MTKVRAARLKPRPSRIKGAEAASDYFAGSSGAESAGLVEAMVAPGSPTLKRAKRRTAMFSPSLPILAGDQLRDGHGLVLDEGLLVEADLLVELAHLAFDDLLDHVGGLAGGGGLRAVDVLLLLECFGSDIFLADELGVAGGDVHGDVVHQFLEVVGAGDEVALAVDLDQHADLAAGVDVAGDRAFAGGAGGLLGGHGHAALAEHDDGLLHVALGLDQGVLAIHHGSAGLVAELADLGSGNIYGTSAHSKDLSCKAEQI